MTSTPTPTTIAAGNTICNIVVQKPSSFSNNPAQLYQDSSSCNTLVSERCSDFLNDPTRQYQDSTSYNTAVTECSGFLNNLVQQSLIPFAQTDLSSYAFD